MSLLNDQGYLAFCESDFVVIPSGILLNGIANVPVFLNDPTTPHGNVVTFYGIITSPTLAIILEFCRMYFLMRELPESIPTVNLCTKQ